MGNWVLGVLIVLTGMVVTTIIKKFGPAWFIERYRSQVTQDLEHLKVALDQQREQYRLVLTLEGDRQRALLEKLRTDYAIWAQERHKATRELFAELLRLEILATDASLVLKVPRANATEEDLVSYLESNHIQPEDKTTVLAAFRSGGGKKAHELLQRIARHERAHQLAAIRNAAEDAYYQSVLYLSENVDSAAKAVLEHLHSMISPYYDDSERISFTIEKNKLRFLMLELMNASRADLGRGQGTQVEHQ